MASCGSTTCDKFDITQAKWFKIQQLGMKDASTWYLASVGAFTSLIHFISLKLSSAAGEVANSSIPNNLAPGDYLIRHEIIALQLAVSVGGAEFYPSCSQLRVGGDQTGAPRSSDLVSLPGAYSDTDPGIYTPNVYNPGFTYTFPGPPIASFISGNENGTTSGNITTPSTTVPSTSQSTTSQPTTSQPTTSHPSPSSSASSRICKIVNDPTAQDNQPPLYARHIMRKLGFSTHH